MPKAPCGGPGTVPFDIRLPRRAALALAAVSPALAQSTLVVPLPGGGYQVVTPQGFSTLVLPMPGDQGQPRLR